MSALKTSSWIIVICAVCCVCFVHVGLAKTHFKYMTNYCSKTLKINESLLIALTPQDNLPDDRDRDFIHCDVDLVAPTDMKLFAHFLQLSISPMMEHTDRLQLYDMRPAKRRLTPDKGLYGKVDRSLLLFDDSGSEVDDYRTSSNELRLDYLGKPTTKSPGFRVLVTAFFVPDSSGGCPDRHYLCQHRFICIPRQVACDGFPNCGKDDTGDEEGCDRDDTVTDLLAEYSLARDIIVVIFLPVIIFIAVVIVIFCVAKRYIREKINKPEPPAVHFTSKKDGRVTITETHQLSRLYAPPSYEDIVNPPPRGYEPPPAYSSLADLVRAGTVDVVDSEDESKVANMANERRRRHERNLRSSKTDSTSSLEENGATGGHRSKAAISEYENYRLHCVWPSDTDDDEETKQKRRRKGGKCKSKGKRQTDNAMIALHGISPLASPDSNSPSHSVPSSDSAAAAVTGDSSTPSASSPDLPLPSSATSSSSSLSRPHPKPHNKRHIKRVGTDDFISIHTKPNKSSPARVPCKVEITSECQKSETSSCGDNDPKSETESRATSKRNSKTESLTSLTEKCGSRKGLDGTGDLQEADENGDNNNTEDDTSSLSKVKLRAKENAEDDDADVSSESESESVAAINKLKGKLAPILPVESKTNGHVAHV